MRWLRVGGICKGRGFLLLREGNRGGGLLAGVGDEGGEGEGLV